MQTVSSRIWTQKYCIELSSYIDYRMYCQAISHWEEGDKINTILPLN